MPSLFETPTARPDAPPYQGPFAQVALEQGLETPDGLSYAVPEHMADLRPGDRVLVPLGKRNKPVPGYVLSLADTCSIDRRKIKPIAARDNQHVTLPDDLIELARWISRYYCCPLGMVFAAMLPAAVKRGTGLVRRAYVELHDPIAPDTLDSVIEHHRLRGKQAAALTEAVRLDQQQKLPIDLKELARRSGAKSDSPLRRLIEKGLLKQSMHTQVRAVWADYARTPPKDLVLNEDQAKALEHLTAALDHGFGVHLLHGVTGSGKTEVYMQAIERVLAQGRRALVLVPEIALTPQMTGRFIGRFDRVAVLHSGLTAAQRHEQWMLIREGWARVVVGARSAVFAPISDLGLIVVDEEHDGSYKQDQAPRYHGRDVAIKRAQMHNAPVILGSATPSLESYHNATVRRGYHLLTMPNRVANLPLPKVHIVNMLEQRNLRRQRHGEKGVHLLGLSLEQAMRQTFDAGGQALLLLNRRGYANYIACPDHTCGWMMSCEYCDATMVYHLDDRLPTGGYVRCHYCGFENLLPARCPVCEKKVTVFGLGTQRVEREITRKFPDVRMLRMDSDAMHTGKDYEQSLREFGEGKIHMLVGTQMIAKGLDFDNVRLVGVISADTALGLPDFRAAERTFQLVAQVAGRSGRGPHGGQVVVQTFTPDHPVIQQAANHDYLTFAQNELEHRRRTGLPPATRMARIVTRDEKLEKAQQLAAKLSETLHRINDEQSLDVRILGPLPPAIARIGGFYRQQIELIAQDARTLQKLIAAARASGELRADAHVAVDVDPISLM